MKNFVVILILLFTIQLQAQEVMYAHFIDMGQGMATLLQFPNGIVMIDAGRQLQHGGPASSTKILTYLSKFFTAHPEYKWTIDAIIVTHNHEDHTGTIPKIYADHRFKIKNIISSRQNITNDVEIVASNPNIKRHYINYTEIIPLIPNGITGKVIDPLGEHNGINPEIKIFSGQIDKWKTNSQFKNSNWHSLATRIKFGKSSFLFTGDMQEESIQFMLDKYKNHLNVFDVDVYQVGHHGSDNATTKALFKCNDSPNCSYQCQSPG